MTQPQTISPQLSYQQAIEQVSSSAVFMLDERCRVISWNQGGKILKGYSAMEVIGKHFFKFYPEEDKTKGKPIEILRKAVKYGSVVENGWRLRKNGSQFWAHIVTTTLYDNQKKVKGFIKIVNDYSEYKRLDTQRETLMKTVHTQKKLINNQNAEIKKLKKQLAINNT